MTDKLEFKLIKPSSKGEIWAEDEGRNLRAVEIYINNRELVDILREIEKPFAEEEGHPNLAGGYGHNIPQILYKDFTEALIPETYSQLYGVELLCCKDCGVPGCWSPKAKIRQDEEFVYWEDFCQNHRKNWVYNLSYKFAKAEYEAEMEKLKSFAEEYGSSVF